MSENPTTNLVLACIVAIVLFFIAFIFSVIARRYSRYEERSDGYGHTWSVLVERGPVGACASCLGSLVGIVLGIVILAVLYYAFVVAGRFVAANWNSITRLLSVVGVVLAGLAMFAIAAGILWGVIKFAVAFVNDLFHPEKYD